VERNVVIRLENVTKSFDDQVVLKKPDFGRKEERIPYPPWPKWLW